MLDPNWLKLLDDGRTGRPPAAILLCTAAAIQTEYCPRVRLVAFTARPASRSEAVLRAARDRSPPLGCRSDGPTHDELGNGYHSPPSGGWNGWQRPIGPPRLLLEIEIEFTDGPRGFIGTDESWRKDWGRMQHNDF